MPPSLSLVPVLTFLFSFGVYVASPTSTFANQYSTQRTDVLPNTLYNAPAGALLAFNGAATSGLVPVLAGKTYVASIDAAPSSWCINQHGLFFWTPAKVFNSRMTAGYAMAAGNRSVRFTAPITGFVGFNMHYAPNAQAASVTPVALDEVTNSVMMSESSLAAGYVPYSEATREDAVIVKNGDAVYVRSAYTSSQDLVHRFLLIDPSWSKNENLAPLSYVAIAADTASQLTHGAFLAGITSPFQIETDNSPAYRMNGVFLGGAHGLPSWEITAPAHGKTNANARGSLWSIGGVQYMITRVVNSNALWITEVFGGADDIWTFAFSTPPSSGALTHVSSAVATASISYSSRVATQLWPSLQNFTMDVFDSEGEPITSPGAYETSKPRVDISYTIPNQKAVLDHLHAMRGSNADIQFNDPAISGQVGVSISYLFDNSGAATAIYTSEALQSHWRNYLWPTQHQALTLQAGQTLHFFAEGVTAFGGRNFAALSDITGNGSQFFFDQPTWSPASYWSDNEQHIPTLFAFVVKNSNGTIAKTYVMANDDADGLSATSPATRAGFLSGANKFYPVQAFEESVEAGQVDVAIGAFGFIDPARDNRALINFAYPRPDGSYGFRWHSLSAQTAYEVPVGVEHAGKSVTILKRAASVIVSSAVVSESGTITVSSTAAGGFSALLQ